MFGRLVEVDNETSAAAGRAPYFKGQTVQSFGEALYVYTVKLCRYRDIGEAFASGIGTR